jgi:hypothetical protein
MAFARGLIPTPRHKLLAAIPFRMLKAPLPNFAVVPKQLGFWGNQQYGDCVTAEEAYAKAVWSVMCGLPELFIPESEAIRWASANGFLNGANLTDVMDAMAKSGFNVNGINYTDGHYNGVDYSNEAVLQAAIEVGPVKLGIDANALPSGAGNGSGWYAITQGNFGNEDHCTGLSGHGTAVFLYQALYDAGLISSPTPPAELAGLSGYLFFTWDSIGFVTHQWLMGTCAEAWVRNPTTPGQSPNPIPPVPVPPAPPVQTVTIPSKQVTIPLGHGVVTIPGGTYPVTTAPAGPIGFNINPATIQAIIQAILALIAALNGQQTPCGK